MLGGRARIDGVGVERIEVKEIDRFAAAAELPGDPPKLAHGVAFDDEAPLPDFAPRVRAGLGIQVDGGQLTTVRFDEAVEAYRGNY